MFEDKNVFTVIPYGVMTKKMHKAFRSRLNAQKIALKRAVKGCGTGSLIKQTKEQKDGSSKEVERYVLDSKPAKDDLAVLREKLAACNWDLCEEFLVHIPHGVLLDEETRFDEFIKAARDIGKEHDQAVYDDAKDILQRFITRIKASKTAAAEAAAPAGGAVRAAGGGACALGAAARSRSAR